MCQEKGNEAVYFIFFSWWVGGGGGGEKRGEKGKLGSFCLFLHRMKKPSDHCMH